MDIEHLEQALKKQGKTSEVVVSTVVVRDEAGGRVSTYHPIRRVYADPKKPGVVFLEVDDRLDLEPDDLPGEEGAGS